MLKFIDLSFNVHPLQSSPAKIIEQHKEGYGYIQFIKAYVNIQVIGHINFEGSHMEDEVRYNFFKGRKKFYHIPFKTYRFIKKSAPDIILVQGLGFPLQTILLRLFTGNKCKILVQHHAERPFSGIKRIFQIIAGYSIDAYLFTSLGNADLWTEKKIINIHKCHEILEASTFFRKKDKTESRERLALTGRDIFLWVGRLESNKDPITILKGFEQYLKINALATLYMIYQEEDLIAEVKALVQNSALLTKAVYLVGRIEHKELQYWFSAADYYLSGSHREGSGYALIEALACGCIPIVTDIPPFRKITAGQGFLFHPGDANSLCATLAQLNTVSKNEASEKIVAHFNNSLSFKRIAEDILLVCKKLTE